MNLKVILYSVVFFSGISALFSLVFYFGDWHRLLVASSFGVLLGLMAAPEIEPKKFKHGWLLQVSAGALAGILFGFFLSLSGVSIAACGIIGGVIGWLAPSWVKHATIP